MATPTGELIGQQITINSTEQIGDFYMGQLEVDLSTEYDLTKGVDITFDGQLYKNVSAQFMDDDNDQHIIIGEFTNDGPILTKYPFCIDLIIDGGK